MNRALKATGAAVALALAGTSATVAGEGYEDATGDALGSAPDMVAVTVDEPEGPVLSISVLFTSEPPLEGDGTDIDMVWLALDTDPDVTFPELDGYSVMALGPQLPRDLEAGSHLLAGDDLYWHVVDVEVDGPSITFRLDRKLLGDPAELYLRVYSATLEGSLYTEQVDHFPEEGAPPLHYRLGATDG